MQQERLQREQQEQGAREQEQEQAHEPEDQTPPQEEPEQKLSSNAQRRITELVAELRKKDQDLQQAMASQQQQGETLQQMEARLNSLMQQHEQLLQQNLDHLDPDTRMQVLQDARIQEHLQGLEQRIMGKITPTLRSFEERSQQTELTRLAETYPNFDASVHGPLIETFRRRNSACTIEQAFRAVAEPEELMTRSQVSARHAVPPIVPPGNSAQRFSAPSQQQQSDPEQELIEEAQRIKSLRASGDPTERKDGMRMLDEHLKKRLAHRFQSG